MVYGAFNPSSCEVEALLSSRLAQTALARYVLVEVTATGESSLFGVHEDLGLAPSSGLHITKFPFNPRVIPKEENKGM